MEPTTLVASIRAGTIVDLSVTLSEDLPCSWPTAVRYRHTTDHWFNDVEGPPPLRSRSGAPYHSCVMEIDEHTGTHFDAPSHFIPPPGSQLPNAGPAGAITSDKVGLDQFIGPAVVVDVRGLVGVGAPGMSPRIEASHLLAFEAVHGMIEAGDVVLFHSGWDDRYLPGPAGGDYVANPLIFASTPAWPAPTPAAIELLRDRGVRCVGTDGVSMGPADDGAPTHVVGLSAGMVYVEALCRLGDLPTRGAVFFFLPLKIGGGTGGPGRALAMV